MQSTGSGRRSAAGLRRAPYRVSNRIEPIGQGCLGMGHIDPLRDGLATAIARSALNLSSRLPFCALRALDR